MRHAFNSGGASLERAPETLELLSADADFANAMPEDLDAMLQSAGLEPALRSALVTGDAGAVRALLGAPENVCCLINPAEEEEEGGEREEQEDEDQDEDENEDEVQSRERRRSQD